MSQDLKAEVGGMTAEAAATRLDVSLSFFRNHVSKNIGRYIGNKKYYTEQDLEQWLKSQMVANI